MKSRPITCRVVWFACVTARLAAGTFLAIMPPLAGNAAGQAAEITVEHNVAVPMSDGVVLRANVFRPGGVGPFPVLVVRTPYGKTDKVDESLVNAGFIVVSQDARGRYASDGQFESFVRADTHDAQDGRDTVEWAAKLAGSTGKVGLMGTSYPAFLAWRAAGAQPASLAAMAAFSIPASYLDLEGPGTIRPGRRLKWWYGTISPDLLRRADSAGADVVADPEQAMVLGRAANAAAAARWEAGAGEELLHSLPWANLPDAVFGSEAVHVQAWLREPWRDPWQLDRDASRTRVPNLNVCGWYDHCNGSIDLHRTISSQGASFHAKRHSRLIVGPWSHQALGQRKQGSVDFGPAAELNLNQLYIDWFGAWLRGDKNDVSQWPPVRVFVMGSNEWRNFYEWPPKYAAPREWYLDSGGSANTPAGDGRLLTEPAERDSRDEYVYDPRDPVPTLWSRALFTQPADQRPLQRRTDILVYQTPPLPEFVETIGYPELILHIASSCPDTDFFGRLIDVAPDGTAVDVTAGMIRARYRPSPSTQAAASPAAGIPPAANTSPRWFPHATPNVQWLRPGEITELRIRLRPTAHRFLAGHRIRLDITSSDFPNFDRNHNTASDQNADAQLVAARQSVHHGRAHPTRLILPVMRQKKELPLWAEGQTSIPPPKFVREFGRLGSEPGEFHSPIGIAIDAEDRLYITEFANHRVQVLDAHGHSLRLIRLPSQPGGIAVDSSNRVYVALMLAHKVVVLDRDGQQVGEWGKAGSGDGEFNQPGGIAIGPDHSVYVVDQQNHRVQRFTAEGKFLGKFGEYGSQPGQFGGDGPRGSRLSGPHFCAFDPSGRLYTTEGANLRIQCFDPQGTPLRAWTGIGEGAGGFGGRPKDRTNPFEGPIAITVDRRDRIWVSSTNNRLQCFSPAGKFLTGIGDEGAEPGEFIIPHGLAVDSRGLLYVVDASNQRVQVFELP